MKITLQNQELQPAISLLQRLSLKPGDSRHRSKMVKLLLEAAKTYDEDSNSLLESYANKSADGSPIINGNQYDVPKDKLTELGVERKHLNEEERVIEGGMYVRNIDAMPEVLENITETLSGQEADIYDKIMDQFDEQRVEAEQDAKQDNKKESK